MKNFIDITIALFLLIFLTSCGSARKARKMARPTAEIEYTGQVATGDTLKMIQDFRALVQQNFSDFETFSGKAKVNFTDKEGKTTDVNINIRIKKDSAIWVSLNALLGIEAARVLITPDSVKLINKLDKKIQEQSVSYLQELVNLPLEFKALQDILLGNAVYFDDNVVAYQKENDRFTVLSVNDKIKSTLNFDYKKAIFINGILREMDTTKNRVSHILQNDYDNTDNRWFSLLRNITVDGITKANIVIQFKQYEFNVPVSFPFNYPKDYAK